VAEKIEVGDTVKPIHYSQENAGRHYKVESVAGSYLIGSHGAIGSRYREEREFHVDDVKLIRKNPHRLKTKPLGHALPELFANQAQRVAIAIDSGHNGYGMSMAVLDESFGPDGHPINVITQIKHHTNEVLEDPAVRLEYTTPSTENFQDKLAWYDLAIAEANEKVKKADNKSALRREQAAELRRSRSRLAVDAEKASLGMPLEPVPSRYSETVITFTKKFGNSYGKSYVYAAVRAPGLSTWSVTGKSELTYATWEQVVEFILREEKSFTHRRKALQSIRLR
jgi:hypothetical protein